jgi:hypothetical protein
VSKTQKWWATTCTECGGFVLVREVQAGELVAPRLDGTARCVRCHAYNDVANTTLFVVDGVRLRRISLNSPVDYVK